MPVAGNKLIGNPEPAHEGFLAGLGGGLFDSTLRPLGHMIAHPPDTRRIWRTGCRDWLVEALRRMPKEFGSLIHANTAGALELSADGIARMLAEFAPTQ